jgi:hypothetical protein
MPCTSVDRCRPAFCRGMAISSTLLEVPARVHPVTYFVGARFGPPPDPQEGPTFWKQFGT